MPNLESTVSGISTELVEIMLRPGQDVQVQTGAMIYISDGIVMRTNLGGGILKGIKRRLAGESFLITTFENTHYEKAAIGVGAYYPGQIVAVDLSQFHGNFYSQQRCFLCADTNINISIGFVKRIGAGIFGGEGFVLQKLTGGGLAFLQAGGSMIKKELLPGETLRIDTGCLLGFSGTVDYDISLVSGIMNPLFGKEGFFLASLTGPGVVYMQSLPFARLAENMARAILQLPRRAFK
jgi:uncharacterized protein (TIGR00266 family)